MPKSYMIKRYRKKEGKKSEAKINKNRDIQDFSTDTNKNDSSTTPTQEQLNGSTIPFKIEEVCAKQDLSEEPKLLQKSTTKEYTETIPVFENVYERSSINPALLYEHHAMSYPGVPFTGDNRTQQHGILPQYRYMLPYTLNAPVDYKLINDGLTHCGIPDNISPKSATSAKDSPTFPTNASLPTPWSPHSILPPIKANIFNFDSKSPLKSPNHLSSLQTDPYLRCNDLEFGVSTKHNIPKHIPVLPQESRVIGQAFDGNSFRHCNRYDPRYCHGEFNAVITDEDPKGRIPLNKPLTKNNLSRMNMLCNLPLCKSTTDVELSSIHRSKSISSERIEVVKGGIEVVKGGIGVVKGGIEVVNDGFGITNPALAPLVINDDTVKAKQPNQICACQLCGLIFHKPKLLQRHITKIHDKIKKFLCTICSKGFNDKFDLKRHTRIHTDIRPFKCPICEKGFSQRCSLEAHGRKVHSQKVEFEPKQRRDKIHICEECGNSTKDPYEHYVHIKHNHPYSALLSKFHDKRQFKYTDTRTDGAYISQDKTEKDV